MDKPDSVTMPIEAPVKYPDGNGGLAECYELEIVCHSRKQYKKTIYFSTVLTKIATLISLPDSLMGRLINSAGSEPNPEQVEDTDSEAAMTPQQLSMAIKLNAGEYNIDVEDMLDRFEKLTKSGIILVEGKPINDPQIEELEPSDLEKAMYVYLANFLMPLVMKNLMSV